MQISAFGSVSDLQFEQYLLPAFGGVPQAMHITAWSLTSFPQFRQYMFGGFFD
jgi:hypothetical protein